MKSSSGSGSLEGVLVGQIVIYIQSPFSQRLGYQLVLLVSLLLLASLCVENVVHRDLLQRQFRFLVAVLVEIIFRD